MARGVDRSNGRQQLQTSPKVSNPFRVARWIQLVLVAILLQTSYAAVAGSASSQDDSSLPSTVSGSTELIQQIIDEAERVVPGRGFNTISFGLRDDKIGVYVSNLPENSLVFWLEDGKLVPDGVYEYESFKSHQFTIDDLEMLVLVFDDIVEDVSMYAESNQLGIDKRTSLYPVPVKYEGTELLPQEPVVHFMLGDPREAVDGLHPCIYRMYSMRTGQFLWQSTPDPTYVCEFFTD